MRFLAMAVVFCFSAFTWADTITVKKDGSGEFTSIQDAIDSSNDGDTVMVYQGVWTEDVYFNGRAITLTSQNPDDPCTVNSTILNATITFDFGESEFSIVEGFTFVGSDAFVVCSAANNQFDPAIYEDIVVWQDYRSGNSDIYGKRISTGVEFSICTNSKDQYYPAIYGNTVVWYDTRNGNYDIYGKNLASNQELIVCAAAGDQRSPAIYGDRIVWQDYRNGNWDIYAKDLATGQEFLVCMAGGGQEYPAIYGDIVVWQDQRNGDWDIYGKNIASGQEFAVCTVIGQQSSVAIFGDVVVWHDIRDGKYDIYGKNLLTDEEFPICISSGNHECPAIDGDIVVWQDTRNGSYDIYGKKFSTNQEFAICTAYGEQSSPAIYCGMAVWRDTRNGSYDIYRTKIGLVGSEASRSVNEGVVCYYSSPTVAKNNFYGYQIASSNYGVAAPDIFENVFQNNITALKNCSGTIARNIISENSTGIYGGLAEISDNQIILNSTGFSLVSGTIRNNLIAANIKGTADCNGAIINNTIVDNTSYGIYSCNVGTIKNNIIAYNNVGIYGTASAMNSYNCFWRNTGNFEGGATLGMGDFAADPRFAQNGGWDGIEWTEGDYHLKSQVGRFDPNTENWVVDGAHSPCIDKGDPCDATSYEPNLNGGRINVGVYGGTVWASKSLNGSGIEPPPYCPTRPQMDFTGDCKVDFADFAVFAQSWLDCKLEPQSSCL